MSVYETIETQNKMIENMTTQAYREHLLKNASVSKYEFNSVVSMLLQEIEELRTELIRLERELDEPKTITNEEIDSLFESLI